MGKEKGVKRQRSGEDAESAPPVESSAAVPPSKKAKVERSRSLFVRSLPPNATDESLTEFFSQHFPVKHATVILDPKTKTSRGYGFVTFTDPEDAVEAKAQLNNQKFNGRPLKLDIAEARQRNSATASAAAAATKEKRQESLAEARKAPKLIIRNLPWSIKKDDQLAALFKSFGKVKYADLPQSKGKLSGFGFVTLRGHKNAQSAMEALNGKVVDGRTIAVDWAVDKQKWDEQQQEEEQKQVEEAGEEAEDDADDAAEQAEDAAEQEDDDESKDKEEEEEDEDLRNFMKEYMDKMEDEDSDAEGEDKPEQDEQSPAKKPLMTDNSTTLFIRNLPFTTTEAQLKSHFEQFGLIRYARVVMDRATDRPAGTGFVCFVKLEDATACLKGAPRHQQQSDATGKRSILQDETADEEGKYTIEGRILQMSQAVSKDEATKLAADGVIAREGKNKDRRNLFLLSEGTIAASSPLYAMLAPSEIKIREQSNTQRKKLIQGNPSLHLSLTRLAIRNIPRNITSKDLKALAREAVVGFAKDVKEGRREPLSKEENSRGGADDKEAEHRRREKGKGVVKQTKIVFENKEGSKVTETDGASKSRGYGFIEYSSHRWALMGLRWLNGHALKTSTGKTHRLIVEFAIENVQVVARRRDLQGKFQGKGGPPGQDRRDERPQAAEKPKGRGKPRGRDGDRPANEGGEKKNARREEVDKQIIQRKRVMRKKKAHARHG